jgi:hypothetical protein
MKMRKPGKRVFLAAVIALLLQPGATQAVITLCNSSAADMGLTYVLEDPNLRLFTRYPYTSRGLFTLEPAGCAEVSMGSSKGMRVHFQTYYRDKNGSWQPGKYNVRNTREVQKSGRQFCAHMDRTWDLSREDAVKCRPGYVLADFGYKLVVPMNAKDYRLSLTANRPASAASDRSPPATRQSAVAKRQGSVWRALPLSKGGVQISVMTKAGFTLSCLHDERQQRTAYRLELSGLSEDLSLSSAPDKPGVPLAELRVSLTFFKAGEQQLNGSLRHDGVITTEVDAAAAKGLKENLQKSKGIFEVAIDGVDDFADTLNDNDRKKIRKLAGKSATINAPDGEAGPLTDLMGLYHEVCLGEEDKTAPLDVSGWLFDEGLNVPGFMVTPSLAYHARMLKVQCMIVGDKKGGFISLHPYPYAYMGHTVKSIDIGFASGNAYRVGAKLSDTGDTVESQLAMGDLTKLVQAMRDERGDMEIAIDAVKTNKLKIPLDIKANSISKFLKQCR